MSRRKVQERHVRKLIRLGHGSLAVTIPIEDLRTLGWREGQKVNVRRRGQQITITDWS